MLNALQSIADQAHRSLRSPVHQIKKKLKTFRNIFPIKNSLLGQKIKEKKKNITVCLCP